MCSIGDNRRPRRQENNDAGIRGTQGRPLLRRDLRRDDPITGRERRRWHPAGTDRSEAERLTADIARRRHDDGYERSSLTVAVYLTRRWLRSKKLTLRASTYDSYRRNIDLHVTNSIGRVPLRRLRPDHLERLYAELADQAVQTAPAASTRRRSSRST